MGTLTWIGPGSREVGHRGEKRTAMQVEAIARRARKAALRLGGLSTETKNQVLEAVAMTLSGRQTAILEANRQDVERAVWSRLARCLNPCWTA
jgi:gamma-glutamyl phosphate reductase